MIMSSSEVKRFAVDSGSDLVGIASVDRFAAAPAGHRPGDLMPAARAVVVCALRLPAGVLDGPPTIYHRALETVHQTLDQLARKIALFIETTGRQALPVPADEPYRHWEPEKSYGRGDLSHKHAAQAAGLGKLGKNSLLMTPRFGNMVHLVSIITDIGLEADHLPDWEPCPEGCAVCLDVCPAGAIKEDQVVDQALCRKVLMVKLPRGMIIEGCNACRKGCPKGTLR